MFHLRRPDDGRWRVALTVVTALLLLAVVVALILRTFAWQAQWLLMAASLAHYVLWLAPVVALLAALNRRRITSAVGVVATVLVLVIQIPPTLTREGPTDESTRYVVLQANLGLGNADPAALVRRVRDLKVDLLATEELTNAEAARLTRAGLPELLPYRYLRPLPGGGSGIGIWSRWPISGMRDVPGFYLSVVRASVAAPGGRLSFVGVHITPPWPFPAWRWVAELPRLRTLLRSQPDDTVIAAGDYNATVDHAQFRDLLTDGYSDAAEDAGAGYLPTYPDDRWYGPVVGIDHVLLRGAYGTRADTLDLPGSDHRALFVNVDVFGR